MPHVYSTAGADISYGVWTKTANGQPDVRTKAVMIRGGANVITKNLDTPKGVCTRITDQELEICMADPAFQRHINSGHIKVLKIETKVNSAVKDMEPKDGSAQAVAADFAQNVVVNKDDNEDEE